MSTFETERWALIALGGIPNKTQVGHIGIDGRVVPHLRDAPLRR